MKNKKWKNSELPVYEIMIDDEDETGIRYLSIVQDPAIEAKGMFFNEDKVKEFRFFATKDEQKIVGPALIPYKKIYRADEDGEYFVMFTPETIQKMVRKFNSSGSNRRLNFNHSDVMVKAYIEQNWIIESDTYDKSKVYGYELPKGTWFVEVKIEDDKFWNEFVKEDGFYSFSIEGIMGQRLVSMSSHMDFYIDNLSDKEIMDLYQEFVIEPKSGESEDEFIGRCIEIEVDNGYDTDQAYAICKSKYDSLSSDKKKAEELADSYKPTEEMIQSAILGLKWRKEYNRGGTEVGVARARDISNARNLSEDTIKRMHSYFSRHEVDKKATGWNQGEDGFPTAGRIAWELWGGDAGQRFASRIVNRIKKENLAIEHISFDFDSTLTRSDIQDIALKYIESGAEVYIISARDSKEGMYELADKLGIPHSNIYATGSNKAKVEKVKELGISKHYDNLKSVIDELGKIGNLV